MDNRVEALLKDTLRLAGENSNVVREGVSRLLAEYEKEVCDMETDPRREALAAQQFRRLCRERVIEEIQQRTAISTIAHFQIVLSVIDSSARFRVVG
jgi:hypothetical protein